MNNLARGNVREIVGMRDPSEVMTLARLGSIHQHRLSFMRILLRRIVADNWRFERGAFEINGKGEGHAVYTLHGPAHSYSLIAFAHNLPAEQRSDRVIATAWDATFTLFDGVPTAEDITRLSQNVPKQEAGRISEKELSLSRANRSVRLWEHVVGHLAAGHQPNTEMVTSIGYLMRTTAVYGSGKFGAADRTQIANRPEFVAPFQVEMMSVYLTRVFVGDLVEHLARVRAPDTAVPLAPELRRRLGIGNSTGLGMAPFLINHPALLNNWIAAREEALARVRRLENASTDEAARFRDLVARAALNVADWSTTSDYQLVKLSDLRLDVEKIVEVIDDANIWNFGPWDRLYNWGCENLSLEGQELLVSLMLEPYPALVDPLADSMAADESAVAEIDGRMRVSQICHLIESRYDWALNVDWDKRSETARAWYVSEEKLEPRLGERFEEDIADYEQPLAPGRDVAALYRELRKHAPYEPVADILLRSPEHRHAVRRVQLLASHPYAEIRDNTISQEIMPIDLLRAKLAFFGAQHFDPRSDRWLRINMFQNAPMPWERDQLAADDWSYPTIGKQ